MEIIYLRQALKDVNKIKNSKLKSKIADVVADLKLAENLSEIKNVKPMSGHSDAYRIRIGNYRLGIYYLDDTITIGRFVKREDIYKLFP
ncbi:type II toxin-antitoxin system RelE family toxin [Polaribacter sp. L3A8]|uniref:type II toxin-antitoxin system RelE family toxin n=1 Tax=Polaribacter sp. L3A8 TaxID=2686361 RepID=UPI00131D30B3|nr:type II toxin-antitoxin system RelE/ParE family toxin [Polaribacter sp. L3A8]